MVRSLAGRAKKKIEELEKLLETAVKNYMQLGGVLQADQKQLQQYEQHQTTGGWARVLGLIYACDKLQ